MKILHVAESIWGGCGTYLNEIVPLQTQALGTAQVRCVVPAQHVAHLSKVAPAVLLPFSRAGRAAGLPRLTAAVLGATRRWQPDVIHAHSTFAGAVVRMLSGLLPVPPVVYCPHGWVFEVAQTTRARRAMQLAERLLSRRCAAIVAISEAERAQGVAAGIARELMTVVPNGLGPAAPVQAAVWDDLRLKVLFVGRLDRQKGVDVLLGAVRGLQDAVCVRIVGEQVLAAQPGRAAAETLPHVELLGWLGHAAVAAQLQAADVLVMPSRWEGFGLVAVEAMRAGKPVVASAVGGLSEIVIDGQTGRLVPVGDAAALGAALLAQSRPVLAAMGQAGRARYLSHYTSERTNAGLMHLYTQVLQAAAAPGARAARRAQ